MLNEKEMNETRLKMRTNCTANERDMVVEYKILAGSRYIMNSHTALFRNSIRSGK